MVLISHSEYGIFLLIFSSGGGSALIGVRQLVAGTASYWYSNPAEAIACIRGTLPTEGRDADIHNQSSVFPQHRGYTIRGTNTMHVAWALWPAFAGEKSHDIIRKGIEVLINLTHRGASGSDPETGDGAGMLIQIPHQFFVRECRDLWV